MNSVLAFILLLSATLLHAKAMSPNRLLHQTLSNSFFALRHGQSLANVAKIISSDPKISTVEHGLSDLGKEQAREAGEKFAKNYISTNEGSAGVAVFSSDFTRARETAEIFANELKKCGVPLYHDEVTLETRLRERYFGKLNGGPDNRYQDVWDVDCSDADHTEFDAESANSVLGRTTELICDLDGTLQQTGKRWNCIVVAHGDVLQILQTGFLKHDDAKRHRSLEHLETATIRELKLSD
jgi:broad specificity phosphatase PhoE